MSKEYSSYLIIVVFLFWGITPKAQTVGVVQHGDNVEPGYVLFSPLTNSKTYLIDECGQVINEWQSIGSPGMSAKFTGSGDIVRARRTTSPVFSGGGIGGAIDGYSWDNELIFSYDLADSSFHQHHDFEMLPNGNLLVLGWVYITPEEGDQVGRVTISGNGMYSERIIEIRPITEDSFDIVWEWNVWDHLVQNTDEGIPNYGEPIDFPERIDVNFTNGANPSVQDWLHANSLDYNPELNQIILNVRNFGEFWVIDHSTTTEEAASSEGGNSGQGGDLLYRWGNSSAYGVGDNTARMLFGQHDAHWNKKGLPGEGNILVFNNGLGRPEGNYTTIDEITPPLNGFNYDIDGLSYGPESATVVYGKPTGENFIFSQRISGSQRLSNGNTLICVGNSGRFIEVDDEGQREWDYVNPSGTFIVEQGQDPPLSSNSVFQAFKYPYDFSGFTDKQMEPGEKIEINPLDNCNLPLLTSIEEIDFKSYFDLESSRLVVENNSSQKIRSEIYNSMGQLVDTYEVGAYEHASYSLSGLNSSTYFAFFWAEAQSLLPTKFVLINE